TVWRPTSLGREGRSPSATTEGIASVAFPTGGGGAWDGLTGTPGGATSVWARGDLPFAPSFRPAAVSMGAPHSPQKTTGPSHSVPHDGHLALGPLTRRASPRCRPAPLVCATTSQTATQIKGDARPRGATGDAPGAAMPDVSRRPRRLRRPPRPARRRR